MANPTPQRADRSGLAQALTLTIGAIRAAGIRSLQLQIFYHENEKEELMIKIVGLLLVAAIATYGLHAFAQIRADVRTSLTPIGSSSSNGISFAWFYDSTERTVVVCRIGQAPADSVDCKVKTAVQ
jgi:hypothetical protein